jgi:hypothetical protein
MLSDPRNVLPIGVLEVETITASLISGLSFTNCSVEFKSFDVPMASMDLFATVLGEAKWYRSPRLYSLNPGTDIGCRIILEALLKEETGELQTKQHETSGLY